MSGFSGEKGSRSSDGENICHEGPEKGRVSHSTPASFSTSFCDWNQCFFSPPLLFFWVFRPRLFVTPKTRPIREQSGRSWRRWDTRLLWICSTRSRLGGSSTSYWSIWVVRHCFCFFPLRFVRNKRQALKYPCVFALTRRGSVYAARERRHLHGGYRLVRTWTAKRSEKRLKMWCFISVTYAPEWNICSSFCLCAVFI